MDVVQVRLYLYNASKFQDALFFLFCNYSEAKILWLMVLCLDNYKKNRFGMGLMMVVLIAEEEVVIS